LPPVSTTLAANFATGTTGVVDTSGKFATGVNDTGGKFPPVSTTPVAYCHRYQRHRRQICQRCHNMGTISGCRHLKLNLKAKFIYLLTLPQRCPNKIIKIFLINDFVHLPPVSTTQWCTLSFEYLYEFLKKFETALIVYSGAWEKLIHEKNQKSKISWHCPFNHVQYVLICI
jgi:hypothetical protein